MLRKLALPLFLVMLLAMTTPAHAITYGELDGNRHPNVGGLVAPVAYSDGTWLYCSGTLISPTVFLTAAHCDEGTARVTVTFDSAYQDGDKTYTGTWYADPLYNQQQSDPHDLAVVVVRAEVVAHRPGVGGGPRADRAEDVGERPVGR